MAYLYDPQGHLVEDTILIVPRRPMHPGIAAINLFKIWLEKNRSQCLETFPDLIKIGTIALHADGDGIITIEESEYQVTTIIDHRGNRHPERCLAGHHNRPHDENYWILNPGDEGDVRYVIRVDRRGWAIRVDELNRMAQIPQNAIYGYRIEK